MVLVKSFKLVVHSKSYNLLAGLCSLFRVLMGGKCCL